VSVVKLLKNPVWCVHWTNFRLWLNGWDVSLCITFQVGISYLVAAEAGRSVATMCSPSLRRLF